MTKSAIYCEHANEMPQVCPCPADCYCKENSCKPRACPTCHGLKKVQTGNNIPKSIPAAEALAKWPEWHQDCPTCSPPKTAFRIVEKRAWEDHQEQFVTDRTTLDNLVYTVFHDIGTIDAALYEQVIGGMERYTHIIYCPVHVFCNPAGDPSRVADMTYHKLYDTMIEALVQRHQVRNGQKFVRCIESGVEYRRQWLKGFLEL